MPRQVDKVLGVGPLEFEVAWLGGTVVPLSKPLDDPPVLGSRLELREVGGSRYALGVPTHLIDAPAAVYVHWRPIEQGTDPADS